MREREEPPSWREFNDFREEMRRRDDGHGKRHDALEQKMWGVIVVLFGAVATYLFSQLHVGGTRPPQAMAILVLHLWQYVIG